ncbi:MAG: DUF418 domain-containing protein [Planctomycetota bacterium]
MAIAAVGPTTASERIQALDIARGMALFGIFMVNVQFMTMPLAAMYESSEGSRGALGDAAHYATRVLFESKSYPLFSMLFGMGLVLMYDRAKAAGRVFAPAYIRRLLLLLLVGLAHAFLLWYGDILVIYACLGLIIMWLAPLRPKTMLTIAAVLVGVAAVWASGLNYLFAVLGQGQEIASVKASTFAEFRELLFAGKITEGPMSPAWAAGETDAIGNGPFANAVAMRAINWVSMSVFWLIFYAVVLHVPAMFLLGGAILRSGVVNDPNSPWIKRFILMGLLIGLPGSILSVWMSETYGAMSPMAAISSGVTHLFGPFVSLGYLGIAMWLAHSGALRWLVRAVAAAGRMALTNYLMQTILVAALAQHWGLGWFGDVTRLEMLWIVLAVYGLQLIVSPIWLNAFGMGPFEYLWRCGTYLRLPGSKPKTQPAAS